MRIAMCTLGILLLVTARLNAQNTPVASQELFTFTYTVDFAARTGYKYNVQGGCANRPFAQDARIWSVLIRPRFTTPAKYTRLDANFPFYSPPGGGLLMVYFDGVSTTVPLNNGGRSYNAKVQYNLGQIFFEVADLTLSELGDVVDLITKNKSVIGDALSRANVSIRQYQIAGTSEGKAVSSDDLLNAILSDLDPVKDKDALAKRLTAMTNQTVSLTPLRSDEKGPVPPLIQAKASLIGSQVITGSIILDDNSVATLRNNLQTLAGTGQGTTKDSQNPPIFIVDEPCLQFSVAPTLSGGQTTPAANFRLRYDFLSPKGAAFLKIRAEGDGAQSSTNFQRVAFNTDTGVNKKLNQFLLAFGGTGNYSLTQKTGQYLDEWRAGGKLQIYTPSLVGKFSPLPGAGTTPVINFEAGGAGGKGSSTKTTDFVGKANFLFTSRVNARLSLDVNGSAGFSNRARFANSKNFTYFSSQVRFTINGDWDYVAKYECGRKDPDYRKHCGWQTGVALGLGR